MQPLRVSTGVDAAVRAAGSRPSTAPVPPPEDAAAGSPMRAPPGTGRERWQQLGTDFQGLGEAQLIRLVVRAEKENRGDSAEFCAALRVTKITF